VTAIFRDSEFNMIDLRQFGVDHRRVSRSAATRDCFSPGEEANGARPGAIHRAVFLARLVEPSFRGGLVRGKQEAAASGRDDRHDHEVQKHRHLHRVRHGKSPYAIHSPAL
jgi:hypothetical protein